MPLLRFFTNARKESLDIDALLTELTDVAARVVNAPDKPAKTWVVIMDFDVVLSVGGNSNDTSIFGDLASIGAIGAEQNPLIVAALSDVLEKHMHIPNSRIFFNFWDVAAYNWGKSGTTKQVLDGRKS